MLNEGGGRLLIFIFIEYLDFARFFSRSILHSSVRGYEAGFKVSEATSG